MDEKKIEDALGQLAKMLTEQEARHKVLREDMKVDFNPFTVVLKGHDETRLHSRVIGHFLDPQGNHYCGALFLREFFKVLGWTPPGELEEESLKKAKIDLERPIGSDGRLDIVIEAPTWIVVIENKINAGEGPKQIKRYHDYLQNWKSRHPGGEALLLFLTKDGKESETAGDGDYRPISYDNQIDAWLEKSLQKSWEWPSINLTLRQYRQVVADQTGRTLFGKNIMELSEIFIKHPELIRDFGKIEAAKNQAREKAREQFLDLLSVALAKQGYTGVKRLDHEVGISLSKVDGKAEIIVVFAHEYMKPGWNSLLRIGIPSKDNILGEKTQHPERLRDGTPLCGCRCIYGDGDFNKSNFYAIMAGGTATEQTKIIQEIVEKIDLWADVIRKI